MSTTSENVKPWYTHPWVWALILIPVASLILSFTMLYVAVVNKDSEVTDDWYRKGKAVNQDFHRDNYATALTISADLTLTPTLAKVVVNSKYTLDANALPARLTLVLSHPTDSAKDTNLVLQKQADGSYQGSVSQPLTGRYYLNLGSSEWRLTDTVFLPLTQPYTLKPEPLTE